MSHPSEELLRRFALGQGGRRESREIVSHLLKGCPRCAEVLARGLRFRFDEDQEDEGGGDFVLRARQRVSRALSDESDDGGWLPPVA